MVTLGKTYLFNCWKLLIGQSAAKPEREGSTTSRKTYIRVDGNGRTLLVKRGIRYSLLCMVTCSWISSGLSLTNLDEHIGLTKTTFTSSDFVQQGPVSSGEFSSPLYGFRIVESDNLGADIGYAVHPQALQLVMQQDMRIKISDLHSQSKFGFRLSADLNEYDRVA